MLGLFILLALIAGVVLLIRPDLAAKTGLVRPTTPVTEQLRQELDALHGEMAALRSELTRIGSEARSAATTADGVKKNQQQFREAYNALVSAHDALRAKVDRMERREPPITPKPDPSPAPPPPPAVPEWPRTLFSGCPGPLDKGFKDESLGPRTPLSIYELTLLSPTEGTYRIVADSNTRSQLFQMLNAVVAPFCDYTVESASPSVINDVAPGRLKRKGDVWEITQKTKIQLI